MRNLLFGFLLLLISSCAQNDTCITCTEYYVNNGVQIVSDSTDACSVTQEDNLEASTRTGTDINGQAVIYRWACPNHAVCDTGYEGYSCGVEWRKKIEGNYLAQSSCDTTHYLLTIEPNTSDVRDIRVINLTNSGDTITGDMFESCRFSVNSSVCTFANNTVQFSLSPCTVTAVKQ